MNNLNSVLIEGNMVRDPLLRSTQKGVPVCNFTIATNRYYRQNSNIEKEVGFFDVEVWGKLVDPCTNQGKKGRGVRVVGRLKQDRWTGSDGRNNTKVAIVAEHVEYRADYKQRDESATEPETLAELAIPEEHLEIIGGLKEFSRVPSASASTIAAEAVFEELQPAGF